MQILGLNKTTLLDYPGCVAATIFVGGCNFRCPFCHNSSLVLRPSQQPEISEEEILSFLKKRKNILKGVCITGGEPTLQADLPVFLQKIKTIGYDIKLDTNGYQPDILKELVNSRLVDYVAMDIKNCPEKYEFTIGITDFKIENINKSVQLLLNSDMKYEFRTTVVKELHKREDLLEAGKWLKGCTQYYLQFYRDSENVISSGFHNYEENEMQEIAKALREIKGMEDTIIEVRG